MTKPEKAEKIEEVVPPTETPRVLYGAPGRAAVPVRPLVAFPPPPVPVPREKTRSRVSDTQKLLESIKRRRTRKAAK